MKLNDGVMERNFALKGNPVLGSVTSVGAIHWHGNVVGLISAILSYSQIITFESYYIPSGKVAELYSFSPFVLLFQLL